MQFVFHVLFTSLGQREVLAFSSISKNGTYKTTNRPKTAIKHLTAKQIIT